MHFCKNLPVFLSGNVRLMQNQHFYRKKNYDSAGILETNRCQFKTNCINPSYTVTYNEPLRPLA